MVERKIAGLIFTDWFDLHSWKVTEPLPIVGAETARPFNISFLIVSLTNNIFNQL